MLDSLVRVSRRVGPLQRLHDPGTYSFRGSGVRRSLDPEPVQRQPCSEAVARLLTGSETIVNPSGAARGNCWMRLSGTLASNDFTYYFTFFSKFFSSFPHGTCSLSVSRKYLALEGHYLPVGAAVPSNTTHGKDLWSERSDGTGLLPSPVRYLNNELHRNPFKRSIPDHNSPAKGWGFSN